MTRLVIVLLFMYSFPGVTAQTGKSIDSLYAVKDYLLQVKAAVNTTNVKEKQIALDSLIRIGIQQEKRLTRHLKVILPHRNDEREKTELSFHLILQSVALYRADLKQNSNSRPEAVYLNKNIPPLVNKIYYYCRLAVNLKDTNTR